MKKVLMIAAVALLAVACNKNQKAVKKLDGTWNATSITGTEGGITVDYIAAGFITSAKITFDGCKLKDDEFCNMTSTTVTPFGTDTEADLYAVTDDGTTLQTKDDVSSVTIETMEIVELTNSTLKVKQTDEDGDTVEMSLEKE